MAGAAEGSDEAPEAAGLRRRAVLAAALVTPLAATGCSKGFGALGTPPTPLPEVTVLIGATAGERQLIARYQAVLERLPGLTGTLAPLLAEHHAHLRALTARLVPGAARPTASPSSSPVPPVIPATAHAATAYLGTAEQAAAARLLGRLAKVSPSLAQLLASIAASEASHAATLGAQVSPR